MKSNKFIKTCISLIFLFIITPFVVTDVYGINQYDIVFRAGNHGNFNGNSKVVVTVNYGERFPDVPDITVDDGYVFNGWDKELPSINSTVEEKQVYVARYTRVISGQEYRVRYVDQNDVDLIAPKIAIAELSQEITERAKTIKNYPVDTLEKTIPITKEKNEIVFVYTLPDSELQTQYITQTVESNTTANTQQENANNTTNIDEQQIPLTPNQGDNDSTENIEDTKIPLADKNQNNTNTTFLSIGFIVGIIILLALVVVKKRKHV